MNSGAGIGGAIGQLDASRPGPYLLEDLGTGED